MAEILISRYEQFIENKPITQLTTNLSASEIERLYGNISLCRMRNMFNEIYFVANTVDKILKPCQQDVEAASKEC